jgi:hypothetical protein
MVEKSNFDHHVMYTKNTKKNTQKNTNDRQSRDFRPIKMVFFLHIKLIRFPFYYFFVKNLNVTYIVNTPDQ